MKRQPTFETNSKGWPTRDERYLWYRNKKYHGLGEQQPYEFKFNKNLGNGYPWQSISILAKSITYDNPQNLVKDPRYYIPGQPL